MALFAVIALKGGTAAVDAAVGEVFPDNSYKMETGKWVVNAGLTTAREVSVKLGLREAEVTHVVFSLRGYSGLAQPDLWEWLTAQSEMVNG